MGSIAEAVLIVFGVVIGGALTATLLGAATWFILFLYKEAKDTGMLPWARK